MIAGADLHSTLTHTSMSSMSYTRLRELPAAPVKNLYAPEAVALMRSLEPDLIFRIGFGITEPVLEAGVDHPALDPRRAYAALVAHRAFGDSAFGRLQRGVRFPHGQRHQLPGRGLAQVVPADKPGERPQEVVEGFSTPAVVLLQIWRLIPDGDACDTHWAPSVAPASGIGAAVAARATDNGVGSGRAELAARGARRRGARSGTTKFGRFGKRDFRTRSRGRTLGCPGMRARADPHSPEARRAHLAKAGRDLS